MTPENLKFLTQAYNLSPGFGLLIVLAIIDMALKGWGMWRAARMEKKGWFIALLLINSIGILPTIFLLMTDEEYKKLDGKETNT